MVVIAKYAYVVEFTDEDGEVADTAHFKLLSDVRDAVKKDREAYIEAECQETLGVRVYRHVVPELILIESWDWGTDA